MLLQLSGRGMKNEIAAIALALAIVGSAGAGYLAGVANQNTTTVIKTSTVPEKTLVEFQAACNTCLQGGEPGIPTSVFSLDGTTIGNGSVELAIGSTHTIFAAQEYTGTCHGVPCEGQNITVYFQSWSECITYPPAGQPSTCTPVNLADINANPQSMTVPLVGENGGVTFYGNYSPTMP
jgi:hypothetical protein